MAFRSALVTGASRVDAIGNFRALLHEMYVNIYITSQSLNNWFYSNLTL